MAETSRKIRRVRTSKVTDFDDQLWPINCASLILAGFVAGIVIAKSDFDDPYLLYNGWVRLFSVAVMMALLFWGVIWLQGKMRRRLLFGVLISLFAHLALFVHLGDEYLHARVQWAARQQDPVIEQYEQITIPDYHWQQIDQPHARQSFEEPIETVAPKPTDPEAVQREAEEPDIPAPVTPPDEPEVPQRQQPNPAITRRAELSAPRRADAAAGAQISRQPWKDRPSPNEPIPEPEITPQPRQAATVPDGTFAPRARAEIRVRADRVRMSEEPPSERAGQVEVKLPRRAPRREPLPEGRIASTQTRQSSPLAQLPSAEKVAPEPVEVARRSATVTLRLANTATARQQADAPLAARPRADPMQPIPSAVEATELAAALAASGRLRVEPAASPVSPTRASPLRRLAEPRVPADLTGPQSEAVTAQAASSDRTAPRIAGPATSAVSRAAESPAPAVQEAAAVRPLPPTGNPADLPSAVAARRTTASQQQPAGSDTAGARPSSLARFVGGTDLPSTAIAVEAPPAANPAAAGGTAASRLQVVSNAAALRSAGQPDLGGSTTAAGTADFALGSAQVVARTGQPRSAGLGRSSPTATGSAQRIARVAGPPAATAASGITEPTATVPDAVASGPSGPQISSSNVQDSAARRGGTVRPFAAEPRGGGYVRMPYPPTAVGAGPTGSSGTPGPVGVAQNTRVTRHESIASAVAGGGTPKPGPTVGGAIAPSAVAEASEPAQAAPSGGKATQAASWQAQVSGPRRQISGLPGRLQGQPMAGALAALTDQGAPLPGAAARRATASPQGSGGRESGPSRSSTLRRDNAGTDLPAAAVPVEDVARSGAGGVAVDQGGLPSSLPTGPSSTVRRAAARLPVAQSTAAAGTADSALGSAEAVVMAGRVRTIGRNVPRGGGYVRMPYPPTAAGAWATVPRSGRTAARPALAVAATLRAEPITEPSSGGPAVEAGSLGQTTADALRAGAAQGSGRVPAKIAAAEGADTGVPPDDSAAGQDDTTAATARRRIAPGDGPGPSLVGDASRGPQRTAGPAGLLSEVSETTGETTPAAAADAAPGEAADLALAVAVGGMRGRHTPPPQGEPSRPEGGLPVRIAAVEGPGGLGYLPSAEVGIPSRRARPESEVIHTNFKRFVIERSGGQVAIDGRVLPEPTEAFRQRDPGDRAEAAQAWGGSEGTEAAVEMGLDYFARHQFPDGHWSLHELPEGIQYQDAALGEMQADSAATGLALLSYLGAGYTHLDDKYRGEVSRGIDWLLRRQRTDGELFTGGTKYARFYSHGIAAIALCEAYGMTRDPALREPAQKAIEFIVRTQHPTRGGWRYNLGPDTGRSTETDTSVSGWMLMALKSAQMAGLEVPEQALEKVNAWLDTARAAGTDGQYVYNPHAEDSPEQRAGRQPNLAMTSEAMLMRMYLGHDRDDRGLIAGAKYLKNNLPEVGTPSRPLRDCYYWYYATQAMFQMQDDYWTAWNDRLRPLAASSQVTSGELAGSWHPLRPVEDRWGRAAGRHYVTALHILMLEVYYRHLPLFQELGE